jgi:hypothetical protein
MTVYLGNAGNVAFSRSSEEIITGSIAPFAVNIEKDMFSFDFKQGALITGDLIELDGGATVLTFITAAGWVVNTQQTKGSWFVNVDQLGGIRLYDTYQNAVAGLPQGRVGLTVPGASINISCRVINAISRILANIIRFELSTDRETVDTTSLSEDFRSQYSTVITGSGAIDCQFDYASVGETEVAVYLHNLILRQQFGATFDARFYILSEGQAQGVNASNDSVWYEVTGIITQAAVGCTADNIIESRFTFVTTGEIALRVQTTTWSDLVLNSAGDRLLLVPNTEGTVRLVEEL